ncbi:MAG: DUF4258 domain-containing protein [Nitrospirae bacterium]|nr:DUF4258 domain-containing protein [Nitrospirota bacterium]
MLKSNPNNAVLESITERVKAGKYRLRIHAVRHMIEEGFSEGNIIQSIIGGGDIIENYTDDHRCLIFGNFHFSETTISPLHVICDYSMSDFVDIVTAYIPQKPWWISPTKRGKKI